MICLYYSLRGREYVVAVDQLENKLVLRRMDGLPIDDWQARDWLIQSARDTLDWLATPIGSAIKNG